MLAKLMVLYRQVLFSLAIAAIAEVILMQTSVEHVPSLQCCSQVPETGHLLQILADHTNICTDVVRAVGPDVALFCADFHSICRCSVSESVDEVLQFTIAAAHSSANRRLHIGLPPVEMDVW